MKIFDRDPTFRNVLRYMKSQDYVIYTEPYKLNIVGVRNAQSQPNKFDDDIFVFDKTNSGIWEVNKYPATTDIGTYFLLNPMSDLGSAMLKEGQYVDSYARGLHRGSYTALVQTKPVVVYRDYDRNATFDFNQDEMTGKFGINIHKAGENSIEVNDWSAGCQVFSNRDNFNEFMDMTKTHADNYGNSFTYTLIDERAIQRRKRRTWLFIGLGIGALGGGLYLLKRYKGIDVLSKIGISQKLKNFNLKNAFNKIKP